MNTQAQNNWKATRERTRARITGRRPAPAAVTISPREITLGALARSTGQRPALGSLLAEAAAVVRRWKS